MDIEMASLLLKCPNARNLNFDFCMLGMEAKDAEGTAPTRKRTSVITNSTAGAEALEKHQCDGTHRHVWLECGRAKACEKYLDKFCKTVIEAVS